MLSREGSPAKLTRLVVRHAQPVFSEATFGELRERLWLPKFDRYVSLEQRKALLLDLEAIAYWTEVPAMISALAYCRGPADDKFIHAALASETSFLVTGDDDLLVLADHLRASSLCVLSPANALTLPELTSLPSG